MEERNIVVTPRAILLLAGMGFLLWVFWLVKGVIIMLFIALVFALALEPLVNWLVKRKIPYAVSVISVVLGVFTFIISLASIALTPLIQQLGVLINKFPYYMDSLISIPGIESFTGNINSAIFSQLGSSGGNLVTATIGAFSGALSTIVIMAFTIYLLLDFDNVRAMFINLFPKDQRSDVRNVLDGVEVKLGGWLRGQVVLMLIIGTFTYIGLSFLGVDYALALAVIAGLLEVVPIIGPIISVVPAAIIGFVISPITGVGVLALYTLVQQLENHLIVPKVMQRAVGFNPLVTIIALLVGGQLLGLIGAILAIPFTLVIFEIYKYVMKLER